MTLPVRRVALIGMGLVGSSIARAVRRHLPDVALAAYDGSPCVRDRVEELNLTDEVSGSAAAAVEDADLVILCVPALAMSHAAEEIGLAVRPDAIISDVGSVKARIVADLQKVWPRSRTLVPAHPIAGTEHSGPDAGFATMFHNRWCILTPPEGTRPEAVDSVARFWTALGANIDVMDAEHHDLVLAVTSHVPHLIAYSIVGTASDLETVTRSEVIKYSAGGFRDFTRIAGSDPTMWRDIFLSNKTAVLEVLQRFSEDLVALQRAIRWGDGDMLHDIFTRTRAIRRRIIAAGQDTAAPDFGREHP